MLLSPQGTIHCPQLCAIPIASNRGPLGRLIGKLQNVFLKHIRPRSPASRPTGRRSSKSQTPLLFATDPRTRAEPSDPASVGRAPTNRTFAPRGAVFERLLCVTNAIHVRVDRSRAQFPVRLPHSTHGGRVRQFQIERKFSNMGQLRAFSHSGHLGKSTVFGTETPVPWPHLASKTICKSAPYGQTRLPMAAGS